MQFGKMMQNNIPITVIWSNSKPEVEFQYDVRYIFLTGSSCISAVDRDIPKSISKPNFVRITQSTAEI